MGRCGTISMAIDYAYQNECSSSNIEPFVQLSCIYYNVYVRNAGRDKLNSKENSIKQQRQRQRIAVGPNMPGKWSSQISVRKCVCACRVYKQDARLALAQRVAINITTPPISLNREWICVYLFMCTHNFLVRCGFSDYYTFGSCILTCVYCIYIQVHIINIPTYFPIVPHKQSYTSTHIYVYIYMSLSCGYLWSLIELRT